MEILLVYLITLILYYKHQAGSKYMDNRPNYFRNAMLLIKSYLQNVYFCDP